MGQKEKWDGAQYSEDQDMSDFLRYIESFWMKLLDFFIEAGSNSTSSNWSILSEVT